MHVKRKRSGDTGAAVDRVTVESGRVVDRGLVVDSSAVHQHSSPRPFHRVGGAESAAVVPRVRWVEGRGQWAAGVAVPAAGIEAASVAVEEEIVVGLRRPKVRRHETAVVVVMMVVQNNAPRHRRHLRRHSVDAQLGRQRQPYAANIQSLFTLK